MPVKYTSEENLPGSLNNVLASMELVGHYFLLLVTSSQTLNPPTVDIALVSSNHFGNFPAYSPDVEATGNAQPTCCTITQEFPFWLHLQWRDKVVSFTHGYRQQEIHFPEGHTV